MTEQFPPVVLKQAEYGVLEVKTEQHMLGIDVPQNGQHVELQTIVWKRNENPAVNDPILDLPENQVHENSGELFLVSGFGSRGADWPTSFGNFGNEWKTIVAADHPNAPTSTITPAERPLNNDSFANSGFVELRAIEKLIREGVLTEGEVVMAGYSTGCNVALETVVQDIKEAAEGKHKRYTKGLALFSPAGMQDRPNLIAETGAGMADYMKEYVDDQIKDMLIAMVKTVHDIPQDRLLEDPELVMDAYEHPRKLLADYAVKRAKDESRSAIDSAVNAVRRLFRRDSAQPETPAQKKKSSGDWERRPVPFSVIRGNIITAWNTPEWRSIRAGHAGFEVVKFLTSNLPVSGLMDHFWRIWPDQNPHLHPGGASYDRDMELIKKDSSMVARGMLKDTKLAVFLLSDDKPVPPEGFLQHEDWESLQLLSLNDADRADLARTNEVNRQRNKPEQTEQEFLRDKKSEQMVDRILQRTKEMFPNNKDTKVFLTPGHHLTPRVDTGAMGVLLTNMLETT